MDKELRDRIEKQLPENPYNYEDECSQCTAYSKAQWDMIRAGYHKIEGKPPVLSDEEMGDLLDLEKEFTYPCSDGSGTTTVDCHKLAQAQRDADVDFYKAFGD